jgi:hypothetical protein
VVCHLGGGTFVYIHVVDMGRGCQDFGCGGVEYSARVGLYRRLRIGGLVAVVCSCVEVMVVIEFTFWMMCSDCLKSHEIMLTSIVCPKT